MEEIIFTTSEQLEQRYINCECPHFGYDHIELRHPSRTISLPGGFHCLWRMFSNRSWSISLSVWHKRFVCHVASYSIFINLLPTMSVIVEKLMIKELLFTSFFWTSAFKGQASNFRKFYGKGTSHLGRHCSAKFNDY